MNISGQYSINFGAKLITPTDIEQYDKEKKQYKNDSAYLVEIDPMDENDRNAVWDAVRCWAI